MDTRTAPDVSHEMARYAVPEHHSDIEEERHVAQLAEILEGTLLSVTDTMTNDEAETYIANLFGTEEIEHEAQLFEHVTPHVGRSIFAPAYHPDQAVREASLAQENLWQSDGEVASYRASNALEVYMRSAGKPSTLPVALKQIRQLNESTVLTARILFGLWNTRRHDKQVSKNGSVAILLDEILQWQGIQKHSRLARSNKSKRYTDGYRSEQKQRVLQDLALLASCNVRGYCTMRIQRKRTTLFVDGPYIRYSLVGSKGQQDESIIIGFLVSPGDWITTCEQFDTPALTAMDRQIFQLNPHNDRYALRLALYLTERWREQAVSGDFNDPIGMEQLLTASMIEIDERHMTTRFIPCIEEALQKLESKGIVSKQHCRSPIDRSQARWSKDWLAACWEILPSQSCVQEYKTMRDASQKRSRRKPR